LFLLLKNCAKYIQVKKKYKSIILVINFDVIDYVITRLKQEKLKTKIAQKITIKLICI